MTPEQRREYCTVMLGALLHHIRDLSIGTEPAREDIHPRGAIDASLGLGLRQPPGGCVDTDLLEAVERSRFESESSDASAGVSRQNGQASLLAYLVDSAEELASGTVSHFDAKTLRGMSGHESCRCSLGFAC